MCAGRGTRSARDHLKAPELPSIASVGSKGGMGSGRGMGAWQDDVEDGAAARARLEASLQAVTLQAAEAQAALAAEHSNQLALHGLALPQCRTLSGVEGGMCFAVPEETVVECGSG